MKTIRSINTHNLTTPIQAKLDQLAIDLATNHCTASFGENDKTKVPLEEIFETTNSLYEKLLNQSIEKKRGPKPIVSDIVQHRNILVIGAGGTYDSFKCVPLGNQVIERFDKYYRGKIRSFPSVDEKFETHKRELRLQNREPDFENMLSLYSELILTPSQLRTEISELFNFRYSPSLFYELVAHMFKHSFIDVIINFNFDEILDQALEEELGKENYFHILSDGDCVPIEEMMLDGRLKVPIYIKPHGSVSHKSTLRFTKRHYLDVPEQIKNLLVKLISGERGEVSGKKQEEIKKIEKVNLITVGFNMESLEFGDILDEHLPKKSKIYHICYSARDKRDPQFINNILPRFFKRAFDYYDVERNLQLNREELQDKIYTRIEVEHFNRNGDRNKLTTPFAEIFSYVWRTMYYAFKKHLRPRSIGRHEIISYLFYDPLLSQYNADIKMHDQREQLRSRYETSMEYFLDRTIVEIAIAINRNNGIVEISQLLGDRAGHYYKKYRECYFREKKTHQGALSIYSLINQFGSKEFNDKTDSSYARNIFELDLTFINKLKADKALRYLKSNKDIQKFKGKIPAAMKRWIIRRIEHSDKHRSDIVFDYTPLNKILHTFNEILSHSEKGDLSNPVPVLVLNWLFRAEHLSQTFISNFLNNYDEKVFNSNGYEHTGKNKEVRLIKEIARLFLKSNRRHYYAIRPSYHDSKNYLTESFSKNKILHTTLAVEYFFRQMFLDPEWDIALIISETGSIINFLKDIPQRAKRFKGRKILMINSFDAIKRIHLPLEDVATINEKQNEKYIRLLSTNIKEAKDIVYTFSLPSFQHNHHTMLFLKLVPEKESIDRNKVPVYEITQPDETVKQLFTMQSALYIYRQGFSNNLNPLFLGMQPFNHPDDDITALRHDFRKMLRIFSTTFCRALAFEGTRNIHNLQIDIEGFQKWLPDEMVEKINHLLLYLHNIKGANFKRSIKGRK